MNREKWNLQPDQDAQHSNHKHTDAAHCACECHQEDHSFADKLKQGFLTPPPRPEDCHEEESLLRKEELHQHHVHKDGTLCRDCCCGSVESLEMTAEEEANRFSWGRNWPWMVAMLMGLGMNGATELLHIEVGDRFLLGYFLVAFAFAAGQIVYTVVQRLRHGDIFNEFSLMTIAALGAFSIGEYSEAVSVMIFYRIGEAFQESAINRAKRSIRGMLSVRPALETELRNGGALDVRRENAPGEQAQAVEKDNPYSEMVLSRMLELVHEAAHRKSRMQLFLTKFSKIYTPVVVGIACCVCVLPVLWVADYSFHEWFYKGLGFLVISCPCALVVSIPLGYFGGIGLASKYGILFKGANFLDAAAKVDTVIFDKTGTLTDGAKTEKLKENTPETIRQMKLRHLRVIMLSGDRNDVVQQIGREAGIEEVYGEMLPQHKVDFVQKLIDDGHTVAFAGDGINDAPAVALAQVGFAMGRLGSDATVGAADVVIHNDEPGKILTAIDCGKRTRRIVWENIGLAFGVKLLVMVLLFCGMSELWEAVFADVGVALLAIFNAIRLQKEKLI